MIIRRGVRLTVPRACTSQQAQRRSYQELSFRSTGEPRDVLNYGRNDDSEDRSGRPSSEHVGVEMLYAPLNPADINTIQGKYPDPSNTKIRQSLISPKNVIAGSEGIGYVRYVPSGCPTSLREGDVVTVGLPGMGTLRSFLWAPATSIIAISRGKELLERAGAAGSTLPQLGGTAFRLLSDFQGNGTVIQNAGNSGVGFMVSQLGRILMDRDVISLARQGSKTSDEWEELVTYLTDEGKCTMVVAEEDLATKEGIRSLSLPSKPGLALNAVGGSSASLLSSLLGPGGTMVTYGGMSKQPVTCSTPHFIFKDLRYFGYWHSRWMTEKEYDEKQDMVDSLVDCILDRGVSCHPVEVFSLNNFIQALDFDANQSGLRRKVVFRCQEDTLS